MIERTVGSVKAEGSQQGGLCSGLEGWPFMLSWEVLGLPWGQGNGKQVLLGAIGSTEEVERPSGTTGLVVRRLSLSQGGPESDP